MRDVIALSTMNVTGLINIVKIIDFHKAVSFFVNTKSSKRDNKDTDIHFRISTRDKERLQQYAEKANKSVSHFVRDELILRFLRLEDAKKLDKELEKLKKELDARPQFVKTKKVSRTNMTKGLR